MSLTAIQKATKDCPREDCRISDLGVHHSTISALSWTPIYDKHGNRLDRGDPNIRRSVLRCSTCGRSWSVVTQYNETSVTPEHPWPTRRLTIIGDPND